MGQHNQDADKSRKSSCSGSACHPPVQQKDADIVKQDIEQAADNTCCHHPLRISVIADKDTQKIVDHKQNGTTVEDAQIIAHQFHNRRVCSTQHGNRAPEYAAQNTDDGGYNHHGTHRYRKISVSFLLFSLAAADGKSRCSPHAHHLCKADLQRVARQGDIQSSQTLAADSPADKDGVEQNIHRQHQ